MLHEISEVGVFFLISLVYDTSLNLTLFRGTTVLEKLSPPYNEDLLI